MSKNCRVVYTALFGNYDKLRELTFKSSYCDYICFTDQDIQSDSWNIIKLECDEQTPTLMNRKLKMLPYLYLTDYDASLYIDTNIKIIRDVYPLFGKYLDDNILALPSHNERNCIYQEIDECILVNKISKKEGEDWLQYLKQEKFPEKYGLGENNIILRKHNNNQIVYLMNEWWRIFNSGCKRDQLSLMYLIWKSNVPFIFMDETSRNHNIYFKYYPHNEKQFSNPIKYMSALIYARRKRNKIYYCFYYVISTIKTFIYKIR